MFTLCFVFQDQLSADMYNFVAKEIDYANYFQTVSIVYCKVFFLTDRSISAADLA